MLSLLSLTSVGERYVAAGSPGASHFQTLAAVAVAGNDLAYQAAMAALGFGSLFFCALLYRSGLVPRRLAASGVAGYAVFLAGALLEILGVGAGLALSIPGALFEVFLGGWLLVRGFSPPAPAQGWPPARRGGPEVLSGAVSVVPVLPLEA